MFASISKLFKKSRRTAAPEQSPFSPAPAELEQAAQVESNSAEPSEAAGVADAAGQLAVSYAAILKAVPHNLHGKNASAGGSTGKFFIPRKAILDQLGKGAVRMKFRELRTSAQSGVFTTSDAQDETLIDLPLSELVPQLSQDELTRHPRHRIEVPTDISDLFDCKGGGLSALRVMAKKEATATMPEAVPAAAGPVALVPAGPIAAAPRVAAPTIAAPPALTLPAAPIRTPEKSATPTIAAPSIPKLPKREVPVEMAPPIGKIPVPANLFASLTEAQKTQPVPAPAPAPAPPRIEGSALVVALMQLSEKWPASVQTEIKLLKLTNANCNLPLAELGKGLKQGKIEIPWKTIRTWIRPVPAGPSNLGETVLGLPLHTIAPMFLAHNQGSSPQKKADISNIPDLFKTGDSDAKNPIVARSVAVPAELEPEAPAPVVESAEELIEAGGDCVSISLSLLAANWPATLVKDIDPKFLAKAKVEIPVTALEAGLRGGKVDFGWKQLCRWMKPSPADELVAAHEQTRIGLPLSVVAPLFLQRSPMAPKQAHDPAGDIPPVFYQAGTAPVVAETTEELSEPPTEPKVESSPSPAVEVEAGPRKRVQDLAELFGQPEKRNWTPNEIVQRTSVLPGVSGALIALQDGLLVASCMPPEWRTETVAAFLPQIFGRMNQYTKELKMGDLQSVTFTVEKGALQIFAAGIIYFATLSKPEQALPIYELSLIARELSRHTK